jgi:hypothetical protein
MQDREKHAELGHAERNWAERNRQDGTIQLLRWGGMMVAAGLLAAALLQFFLGGFSATGASTNSGWFALIVALMSIPFGSLLLALGAAKWLRNRRLSRGE